MQGEFLWSVDHNFPYLVLHMYFVLQCMPIACKNCDLFEMMSQIYEINESKC